MGPDPSPPPEGPPRIAPRAALIAEATGSLALVAAGCLAAGSHYADGELGVAGIALVSGGVLAGLIGALAPASGAHLNPAVSLAMFLLQRISGRALAGYLVAQAVGAVIGAATAGWILPALVAEGVAYGLPRVAFDVATSQAFLLEVLASLVFVWVWLGVSVDARGPRSAAGILAGLTFAALVATALPLSGAAINPLRWIGPALRAFDPGSVWVHALGPLLGGGLAALLFRAICPESMRTGGSPAAA